MGLRFVYVWDSPGSRGVGESKDSGGFGVWGNAICVWRRKVFLGWDDGGCAGCGIRRKSKVLKEGVEK